MVTHFVEMDSNNLKSPKALHVSKEQDPMSHRIIEKRRRDRMNNCLADLSRLIPADYLKKGRGRIEKTEIIEMAIKHIKYLQQMHRSNSREEPERNLNHEQYRLGYQECMSETMRFLVEVEGYFAREALCVRLINHLQKHCDDLLLQERAQNSTLPSEKDFSHLSNLNQIPNLISSINPIIRLQTQQEYENNSQLKDILAGQIKDEIPDIQIRIGEYKKMENKKEEMKEDNRECSNGASLYKFKNNIKQRFNQDLSETNQLKVFKRRKLSEPIRRNSVTTETYSSENHSSPMDSSQCSPPSSEFRISSESENARISPTGSSVSDNRRYANLKPDSSSTKSSGRYSPMNKYPAKGLDAEKTNFGVPIFALHAKGSFYIPLTIDYHTLVPYLQHNNVLDVLPNVHNIILHPVTINVNFQSNYFNAVTNKPNKTTKSKNETQNGWH